MSGAVYRAKRITALAALVGTASLLAGCTTFGSNVSGSFTCTAPGGSCAPSSTIDDQALASIQDGAANEAMVPAGPYEVDDGDAPGMRLASAKAVTRPQRSVARASGRVLRVVFPAYVDRYGQFHEKSAVQAEVDVAQVPQLAGRDRAAQAPDAGLFSAAESAPPLLAAAAPVPQVAQASQAAPKIEVQMSALGAARTAPKAKQPASPSPLAAIKDEVAQKLAQSAKLKAADFPAIVD